ncbi:unnamed protein product [Anisakis simplex]|uniref:Uncharacterized protein n=1 Tax=Anisakis simplex TaxID=6269 RepID=A0A0M3JTA5_ANISI|nr:unnamed protein product [Anisakis simplex]
MSSGGRSEKLTRNGEDEEISALAIAYHQHHQITSSHHNNKTIYRAGTHSCCAAVDGYHHRQSSNHSHNRSVPFSSHSRPIKSVRRNELGNGSSINTSRRHHQTSEYGSCDPSPNNRRIYDRELDDSDVDTWSSEHLIRVKFNVLRIDLKTTIDFELMIKNFIIDCQRQYSLQILKELRMELHVANDRKSYYKDLYKRERQDRLRDRELRDLVEKKLMDDLRTKELECANHIIHIKKLEQSTKTAFENRQFELKIKCDDYQELERHSTSMRESAFRVAQHYCTPSTSNTTSTMAGAGEALSSTSELFAIRSAYEMTNCESRCELPDETKVFRQPDELSLELPRNGCGLADLSLVVSLQPTSMNNPSSQDATVLEEDKQSDNGYGTTSECASEIRSIRRVCSDSQLSSMRRTIFST